MIITKSPLRISLFGGPSDLPDYFNHHGPGCCISFTIDKFVYVTLSRRHDDKVRLSYSTTELVDGFRNLKHDLIREAIGQSHLTRRGIEIQTRADITGRGSGLGSSAAVTSATLCALFAMSRIDRDIPGTAAHIEVDLLSRSSGYQDPYAVCLGGFNMLIFVPPRHVVDTQIKNGRYIADHLRLYAMGTRGPNDDILAKQRENMKTAAPIITDIKSIAQLAYHDLSNGIIENMGPYLDESWKLKKQLTDGITTPFIDEAYTIAKRAGATGGKICGAGGGGYLLVWVPEGRETAVYLAMSEYKELKFNYEPRGVRVIYDDE